MEPPVQIGPYLVERELARGGMGVVYVARHLQWDRRVALKLILDPEAGEEIVARFQREGEALARIQHPNVVRVHDAGHHQGRPYLALAFVEGGSLSEQIPLEPRAAARLFAPLARALAAGHAVGVLHRDLKPANVLVDRAGVPYLTDYGLASDPERERERLTRTGTTLGTPSYMAPEQAGGEVCDLSEATDVYGLGATLYTATCGVPPFRGSTTINTINAVLRDPPKHPSQHVPGFPRDLETILLRCLEKEPSDRYPSALELAEDLERFLAGQPIAARRPTPAERARRLLRRRPAQLASAAALLLALTLGVGVPVHRVVTRAAAATPTPSLSPTPRPEPRIDRGEFLRQVEAAFVAGEHAAVIQLCETHERRFGDRPALFLWRARAHLQLDHAEQAERAAATARDAFDAQRERPRDYYLALRLHAAALLRRCQVLPPGPQQKEFAQSALPELDEYLAALASYPAWLEVHPDWARTCAARGEAPREAHATQIQDVRLLRLDALSSLERSEALSEDALALIDAARARDAEFKARVLSHLRDARAELDRWDAALGAASQIRQALMDRVDLVEQRFEAACRELELIGQAARRRRFPAPARLEQVVAWARNTKPASAAGLSRVLGQLTALEQLYRSAPPADPAGPSSAARERLSALARELISHLYWHSAPGEPAWAHAAPLWLERETRPPERQKAARRTAQVAEEARDPGQLARLANHLADLGRPVLAARTAERALELGNPSLPSWAELAARRVGWLAKAGRKPEVLSASRVAADRAPHSVQLQLLNAEVELKLGEARAGEGRLSRLLERDLSPASRRQVLVVRASTLQTLAEHRAALADVRAAAAIEPGWTFGLRYIAAVSHMKLAEHDPAIELLVAALRADPRHELAPSAVELLEGMGVQVDFKRKQGR